MTSKLSKIATAVAFLAVAISGCDSDARIETGTQYAAVNQITPATAKSEEPAMVISHASGKYEEAETVITHDVHGNRL